MINQQLLFNIKENKMSNNNARNNLVLTNKQREALNKGLALIRHQPNVRRTAKSRTDDNIVKTLTQFDGVLSKLKWKFERQRDREKNPNGIYHRKRFLEQRLPGDLGLSSKDINIINDQITKLKWRKARAERLLRDRPFPFNITIERSLDNTLIETNVSIARKNENERDLDRVQRVNNFQDYANEIAYMLGSSVKNNLTGSYRARVTIICLMVQESGVGAGAIQRRRFEYVGEVVLNANNVIVNLENILEEAFSNYRVNGDSITSESSAWRLVGIESIDVTFRGIYNTRGRKFFELPGNYFPHTLFKNIKNGDNFCLLWCVFYQLLTFKDEDGNNRIPYEKMGLKREKVRGVRANKICELDKYKRLFWDFLEYVNGYIRDELHEEGCYESIYDDEPHLLHLDNLHHIEDLLNVKIYIWEYKYNYNEEERDKKTNMFKRTLLNKRMPEYSYETDSDKMIIDLLEVTENEWISERNEDEVTPDEKHFIIIPRVEKLTNLAKNGKTPARTLCRQCGTLLFPEYDKNRRVCTESAEVLRLHLALSKEYHELEERIKNPNKRYEELGFDPNWRMNKNDNDDDEDDILLDPSERAFRGNTSGKMTLSSLRRVRDEDIPECTHKDHLLTEAMMEYLRDNQHYLPDDLLEGKSEIELIEKLLEGEQERNRKRSAEIMEELKNKLKIPLCEKRNKPIFSQFEQKLKFKAGKTGLGQPEVFTNIASRTLYPFTCFIDFESYQQKVDSQEIGSKSITYEYKQKPYQVGISFSCIRDEENFMELLRQNGITPFMIMSDNDSENLVAKMMAYIIHASWVIANKIYPQYRFKPTLEQLEEYEEFYEIDEETGKIVLTSNMDDKTCFFCCRKVMDVRREVREYVEYKVRKKWNKIIDCDGDVGKPKTIIDHFNNEKRLACSRCYYTHTKRKNLLYDGGLIVYAHNLRGYDGKVILKEMKSNKILDHLLEFNGGEKGDLEIPKECVEGKKILEGDEQIEEVKCDRREGESRCVHCHPIKNSYSANYNKLNSNRGIITGCRSKSSEKIESFTLLDNIQFKDTLEFTLCSLDAFVKNITLGKPIEELRKLFYKLVLYAESKGVKVEDNEVFNKILMSKGYFPYEFCRVTDNKTTILGLLEGQKEIPPLEYYGKDLSEADKKAIQEEWRLSNAGNLLEYSDFYCIKDVLLLEACFNHYRKQLYNHPYIGLDIAKTVTLASLSRNIRLKKHVKYRTIQPMCDIQYKDIMLTVEDLIAYYKSFNSSVNPLDEKLYNMVNKSIKGGVSSVLQTRVFDQDLEKDKVCMQIDVNSLYPSTYLQDMPLFPKPIENGIWTLNRREGTTIELSFEEVVESGLQIKSFCKRCPSTKIEFPENYSAPDLPELDYHNCRQIDLRDKEELSRVVQMGELREKLSCTHLFINEWRLYKDTTEYQVYERHLRLREMMFAKAGSFLIETKLRIPTDIQESIDYMKKFRYPKKYISNAIKVQKIVKKEFNNNLHEFFHTLPPFPAHKTITYDDLSKYNKDIIKHEYLKANPDKDEVTEEELRKFRGVSSKLVYSFETQDEYVLYNNFLKFLVTEMFVIPEHLYSYVEYETGELMKEFAETLYNARLQYKKNGNNDMQYVMKILLNSAFGRTCMDDSRYGVNREFVDSPEKARARFSRDNYVDSSIINENLVLITSKKENVNVSNGRHIGSFILDSAKVTLMRAVTEMRKKLRKSFETIYTDTDSLFFKIHKDKFDELFSDELIQFMDVGSFKDFIHQFPTKKYSNKDHPIFKENAGKLGCFSLEDGIPRYRKVIALAAKQYLVEEWKPEPESKRAVKSKSKGVRTGKNANPRLVTEDGEEIDFIEDPDALIDVYESVLRDKTKSYDARFESFRSFQMQVYNVSNFKVGIKAYCDKNLIQDDGVTSYFYGQKVTV